MNLSAYDIILSTNQIKTWLDVKRKRLCSVEIPFFKYYYLAERYDSYNRGYSYYLILTNDKIDDPPPRCVYSPYKGLIRIDLRDIWFKAKLNNVKKQEFKLKLEDNQGDCLIYSFDY